jgi:hypothetical protein
MNLRAILSSATVAAVLTVLVLAIPSVATATVTLSVWNITDQETMSDGSHPVIRTFSFDEDQSGLFTDIVHLYGNVFHKLIDTKIDVTSGVSGAFGIPTAPPQHYEIYAATHDILTITSDLHDGTAAHGQMWLILSGTVVADASGLAPVDVDIQGSAKASVEVKVNGVVEAYEEAQADALQSDGAVGFDRLVVVDYSFVFGQPFALELEVTSKAEIDADYLNVLPTGEARLNAVADFSEFGGSRLNWVGLGEIFTDEGEPVADYEVISESGTDYTLPGATPVEEATIGGIKQRFLDR